MAEDRKQTAQTAQTDTGEVTEKQATENGKLKAGFGYRYETVRDKDGNRLTRKVFFKKGS